MDFLFPEYRLDWFGAGPSSPNKTGALLAILLVLGGWPALRFRWGYWLSLVLCFLVIGFLLQTQSRGALIAGMVGMACLLGFKLYGDSIRIRSLSRGRVVATVLSLLVLVFYAHKLGVNDRIAALSRGDESANVRLQLYAAGLRMLADAPQGVGVGEAGNAYGQWYQRIGDSRSYLSLVNSHLTWMVGQGWFFRFLYISSWVGVLGFCWPYPWTVLRGICFASWVVLGIGGFFSSVLSLPWLWMVPGGLLVAVIVERLRDRRLPSLRVGVVASWVAVLAFTGIHALGYGFAYENEVSFATDRVELGKRPETILIGRVDGAVLGNKYGHSLRESINRIGGVTVLKSHSTIGEIDLNRYKQVVFTGEIPHFEGSSYRGELLLLNPPAEIDTRLMDTLAKQDRVTVVTGSLWHWQRSRFWADYTDANPHWKHIMLDGVADYIPNWTQFLQPKTEEMAFP